MHYKILSAGKIPNGMHADPTGQFIVYAIGTNVIKANTATGQQTFMIGHSNNVTCIDMDPCGRYIASGSMNYMGFKVNAHIIHIYVARSHFCAHLLRFCCRLK